MDQTELAARIERLEDIEAIRRLKARYAELCDRGYPPDEIAALFTEDAIWDGGVFGRHVGRAAIRDFFAGASGSIPFALHYMTNPQIEVDGMRATGRWHLFQACTFADGGAARPIWGGARYDEEYVKQTGEWRFFRLRLESSFWTPFEHGWVAWPFVQDPPAATGGSKN